MPDHTIGSLKSEDTGLMNEEQTEEIPNTPQLSRQKVKGTKTGNKSVPRLAKTETHAVFTDYDAVEIFNRVLLKKHAGNNKVNP
jgi:hypothetical protein